jgi:hypothetical protein
VDADTNDGGESSLDHSVLDANKTQSEGLIAQPAIKVGKTIIIQRSMIFQNRSMAALGPQAVIVPQVFRAAAMRIEGAARLRDWSPTAVGR